MRNRVLNWLAAIASCAACSVNEPVAAQQKLESDEKNNTGRTTTDDSQSSSTLDPVAQKRIDYLWDRVSRYQLRAAGDPKQVFSLQKKLALRWSNPVSGVVDGGVFVWTDGKRPVVIAKCYINERKVAWGEVLQSVAPWPISMSLEDQQIWNPPGPGVIFHAFEGKQPKPAASDAARLTQMRGLARRLKVTGIWGEDESSEWELRMLTTPVFRYKSDAEDITDAAVFAFTQGGTNPEAIAIVELLESDGMSTWRIAATRLTKYGIRADLEGKLIADLPRIEKFSPNAPTYYGWHYFARYPFPKNDDNDTTVEP